MIKVALVVVGLVLLCILGVYAVAYLGNVTNGVIGVNDGGKSWDVLTLQNPIITSPHLNIVSIQV